MGSGRVLAGGPPYVIMGAMCIDDDRVAVVTYENVPGAPRPMAALRA
ncbi:hypothetical protein ACFPM3_25020 [Streptomyces coeruleoprunus]|uniref:Uncharacterized protein n=1 Tax=Streptomyces coeruleoprunus TaxID=285563 RepID=A0ABV9XJZ1_9ACTN